MSAAQRLTDFPSALASLKAQRRWCSGSCGRRRTPFLDSPACRNQDTRRGYTTAVQTVAAELSADWPLASIADEEIGQALVGIH